MAARLMPRLILLAAAVLAGPLQALENARPSAQTQAPAAELDELVVKGNHLWQLRKAIAETEARFYARYNELNARNDFDVFCSRHAPLGTRIQQDTCQVAFYIDAQGEEANALLTGGFAPPAALIWLERQDEYRRNALEVINADRELRVLIRQRERLATRLAQRRQEIFADRWIAW